MESTLVDICSTLHSLRDVDASDHTYPLLNAESVEGFRHEAHTVIHDLIRSNFPSLSDTDKPELSHD